MAISAGPGTMPWPPGASPPGPAFRMGRNRTGFTVRHHLWVPTFQLWFPSPSLAEVDLKGSDPWDLSGVAIRSAPGKCPLERPRAPGRSSWVMTPVGGQPSGSGHSPTHLCHTCARLFPERMSSGSLLLLVVSYRYLGIALFPLLR